MRLLLPALCLAALTPLATAAAQTPAAPAAPASPEVTDERCLLAMIALSNSPDQNASRMGQSGVFFFAGRLKGRDPNFDFNKLKPVSTTMSADTAKNDLQQRCGPLVSTSIQQLQTALTPPGSQAAPPGKATPPPAKSNPPPKK
jgi:hypothetical protein